MVILVVFFFFSKQKPAYEVRISDWSSDVCSSDLEQVGKPPPNASCRQSFVMGGTQAPYCVGPPGLERHRTTSQAQVLSDAIAGADDTDAPTRAAANARFKAFIAISLVRSEERRVGKAWDRTCRSRGSLDH